MKFTLIDIWSDPVTYFSPFFFILIGVEIWLMSKERLEEVYEFKDSVTCIGMGLTVVIWEVVMKGFMYGLFVLLHTFALFEISMTDWWAWILILFADDFTFYWHHRLSHEIRVLWAAHVNHHSSERFNLAVALRQSWMEQVYKYFFWLWLPVVGFPPMMIFIMISFSLIYQFWVHTQLVGKLGPLEWFMNTPSHHRVHHSSNHLYLDRNHGGIFIIWDRIFGTFQEEIDEVKPIYGITKNIETHNLFKVAFHEYQNIFHELRKANSWKERLGILFMPPGWSAKGPDLRAKTLRKAWKEEHADILSK